MLIIFLAEVAGAVVLLVFQGVVSDSQMHQTNKEDLLCNRCLLEKPEAKMDRCVSTWLSQAKELLESLEDEVRKGIQADYGKDEGLTSLWNATMIQVLCIFMYFNVSTCCFWD